MKQHRKPSYLHPIGGSASVRHKTKAILRAAGLHTVCESAQCPNIAECFGNGTAVFLILGDTCTRRCAFCAVKKGIPSLLDPTEPGRVAEAAARFGLKHVVITSVTRDDLPDGGAEIFAEAIKEIRDRLPEATVETLVPDFAGSVEALQKVIAARPNIFNHNVETVPRLYPEVRPGADWNRSLRILETAAVNGLITKSGMMLGMGEKPDEVRTALEELRSVCCKIITLGQYLAPSRKHRPVARYLELAEFEYWRKQGLEMGFKEVFSAPLVRSSYHADSLFC